MICIDTVKYIADFERVIECNLNVNKDKLISLLESRLNGSFEPNCLTINKNNISFDFEKNLTDEQKYYLEIFDKFYYKEPLINNKEYMQQIINPIVLKIKNNYDELIHFTSVKPDSVKQSLLFLSSFGNKIFELNNILEFCLLLSKLDAIGKLITEYFHTILGSDFDIKNFIDINKPLKFSEFYSNISDYIRNIYYKKMDDILKTNNINSSQKEELEIYNQMVISYKKILNGLFWIVYANEFKFIDTIQNTYLIRDELFEEYEEKLGEWFNYEDEVVTESGELHSNERNAVEEILEKMEELEEKAYDILEKKAEELQYEDLDNETKEKILDEELDKYINTLTNDAEEKEFYKTQFGICITFVKMNTTLKKMHDMFEEHFNKL